VGSTVHALEHAAVDQLAQVATNRLGGDAEVVGEGGDFYPAVGAGPGQNLALTLVSLHPAPPSRVLDPRM
jgi:hypothetical protein